MGDEIEVILKLGGSVITWKDRPFQARIGVLRAIGRVLRRLRRLPIIVHGGGSFGHYLASRYGLGPEPRLVEPNNVAAVKAVMHRLHSIVLNSLIEEALSPYSVPADVFVESDRHVNPHGIRFVETLWSMGLAPVTFGDVLYQRRRPYILSGDSIAYLLSGALRPKTVVFSVNVDGVLDSNGRPVPSLTAAQAIRYSKQIVATKDATGGMATKLLEAARIARLGVEVRVVNGLYPERILEALNREATEGTLITSE